MRRALPIHYVTALMLTISVTSAGSWAQADDLKRYRDVASYKADLIGGITKEQKLDINSDGQPDVLIFYSDSEQIYLGILIREKNQLILLDPPAAEEYDIEGSPGRYELKIGHGTFPSVGDVHGSDRYYWYDFYKVVGHSLQLTNSIHAKFYRKMLPLYRQRIKELEQEIIDLKQDGKEGKIDDSTVPTLTQFRRDHINRYKEFISKASEIIRR